MSKQHTPEPWTTSGSIYEHMAAEIRAGEAGAAIAQVWQQRSAFANAQRIVTCVNACAGLSDPEVALPALVAALQALIFPVEAWNEAMEQVTGDQPVVIDALIQARAALALVRP